MVAPLRDCFMSNTSFSAFGLILDIIGVILLWRFGLPPSIDRGGAEYLVSGAADEEEVKMARFYDRLSHIGIGLVILGFVFQLAGTLKSPNVLSTVSAFSSVVSNSLSHSLTNQISVPVPKP